MAENVAESLQRGMRVIVSGRLRQRNYETQAGEKRTVYEVEVDDVGPSLLRASAKVNRATRTGGDAGGFGGSSGGGSSAGSGNSGQNRGGGGNSGGSWGGGSSSGGSRESDPWAGDSAGYSDEPPF